MVAFVYQTPTFLPHYGDNVKVKSQHICQAIPALLRGLGEAVVSNDWYIIYSLCCTSHENLVLSHLQKTIMTPNTKYDIRWYSFQPISKYIPTPSLVSLSNLNCKRAERALFSLHESIITWITPTGWALWSFSLMDYSYPELQNMFCIAWCQQISTWNKQIESSINLIKQVGKLFTI